MKAYVFIRTHIDGSKSVGKGVLAIEGVSTLDQVGGPYDFIAQIEAPTLDDLGDIISKIQHIEGVVSSMTSIAVRLT